MGFGAFMERPCVRDVWSPSKKLGDLLGLRTTRQLWYVVGSCFSVCQTVKKKTADIF